MKCVAKVDISVFADIIKSLAFLGACQTGRKGLFPSSTVPRSPRRSGTPAGGQFGKVLAPPPLGTPFPTRQQGVGVLSSELEPEG